MVDLPSPKVNYDFAPTDGRNMFREKFGPLSDEEWFDVIARSIQESVIDGVQFPAFPEDEFQNRVHGHFGRHSILEAGAFYKFIKTHALETSGSAPDKRFLDFGAGWGRIIRLFLRDFEFSNIFCIAAWRGR